MSVTAQLAQFAADLRLDDLPEDLRERMPPRHHAALRILGEPSPALDRAVDGLGERWAARGGFFMSLVL